MSSEFKLILENTIYHDKLYLFLQNIFNVLPEDRFFNLIKSTAEQFHNDYDIYAAIQNNLPRIKPFMADLRYGLPALFKQKKIIASQTKQLLGNDDQVSSYLEIGSIGRYFSSLSDMIRLGNDLYIINDQPPGYGILDMIDRGSVRIKSNFINLANYQPINLPPNSLDLVSCYIGLHHIPLEHLDPFIKSICSILKPGGKFILRDHNCESEKMTGFVSLIHSVFNIGSGISIKENQSELRYFRPIKEWIHILSNHRLNYSSKIIYQDHDPSDNGLMLFIK